jgi:uncharacterized integral membrane protein
MAITVRCGCGSEFDVPDGMAGRSGKCRRCGAAVVVPDPAREAVLIEEPDDVGIPTIDAELDPITVHVSDASAIVSFGPEPWYYGLIAGYAWFVVICGVMSALLMTVAIVILYAQATEKPPIVALLLGLLWPLGIVLAAMTIAAPILLAVDVARNIRAIRLQTRR